MSVNYDDEKVINGTAEANEIINYGSKVTINGGKGDDVLSNGNVDDDEQGGDSVSVIGGEGDDSLTNYQGPNSTLDGGEDDDVIINHSTKVKIYGGNGDDDISNGDFFSDQYEQETKSESYSYYLDQVLKNWNETTIDGGAGDDNIVNYGSNNLINGDEGDDNIENYASNVTISGGTGDDNIVNGNLFDTESEEDLKDLDDLGGNNILFKYTTGDGNDVIEGFNATSTLEVDGGDGTYSKETVGDDIVVTIGDGKVTLIGAANLEEIQISGKEDDSSKNFWTLDGTTAKYGTESNTLITISGVKSLDGISLNETTVTISQSSLGTENVTISDGYTLALANDVTQSTAEEAWKLENSTATYNKTMTAGYLLENNEIIYLKEPTSEVLITVKGVKSLEGISLEDTTVTISQASLGTENVTISDGYTLALGEDVTVPTTEKAWKLDNSTATYNQITTEGYSLENNEIVVKESTSEPLITISGVKSLDGISLEDTTVTISKSSLGTKNVTISEGYTLALGEGVKAPTTKEAAWTLKSSTATYKSASTTAGYSLSSDATSITYSQATSAKTLATVKGVKAITGLKVSGNVITVSKSSLNAKKVTLNGNDYTLALGSDVTTPKAKNASWSLKSSTATYKGSLTAGYTLASNSKSIAYSKAKSSATLATVKGVKSVDGLKVSGNVITVSKSSLGTSKVTLSGDDYTLKLGSDVTTPKAKNASWSLKSSTATYKGSLTAGYTLASNSKSISYEKATASSTLATVKGVTSVDGLKVSGSTIKLTGNALASKVTVSGDYNFDFAAEYKKGTITGSSGNDTITARGSSVVINGGKGDDTLKIVSAGTLSGGAGNDTLTGSTGKDSLVGGAGADSLNGGKGSDTLVGGAGADVFVYKSGYGNDVIADFTKEDKIVVSASQGIEVTTKSKDVVFKIGTEKLTVKNGASKYIPLYDTKDKILTSYNPANNFMEDDEAVLTVNKASLSEIVENKSYSALGSIDSGLSLTTDKSYIPVIVQSSKK